MKVALVGDSHFDETSRFEECVRIHDWIANDIAERGVGLVLHSGDVYERKSTPDERRAAAGFFQRCASLAPVVIVRGNHDVRHDLVLLGLLDAQHTIHVVEDARIIDVAGAQVACLAWPRRSSIIALAAKRDLGHEGAEQIAGDALRAVLRGMGQQMLARDCPKILLAHAMVRGSKTSTGQPLIGMDMEVGLDDLRLAGADFYALGHIHMSQSWEVKGTADDRIPDADVVYPGSPRRTAFGEIEKKGYVIYDTDGDWWEHVETPCAPMLLLESSWVGGDDTGMPGCFEHVFRIDQAGAEIRFRYTVDADQREAAFAAAVVLRMQALASGIAAMKLDAVFRSSVKARAPEVAMAKGTRDKLKAFWESQADPPPPERRERLLTKLAEMEAAE